MSHDEIYARLQPIIKRYLPEDVSEDQIGPESDLTNELNINSAHLVDVVLDVEDEFEIQLENEDMEKMSTLRTSMEVIAEKLRKKD